ncbi:unnamed protein product [Paramecium sonneborni]|uniref:Cyclin N-terminal domain-containing protein n=1 Tax=Paramecium sonneborni TaxID=65129 RepID=A0A8S1NCG9_9CILI|nr:unnamed protein product [Paramecium sonneborni]
MRKWDADARLKSYVNQILNVKSTLTNNQKTTSKKKINRDTEYSSNVTNSSDLTGIKDSILYKQLVEYNLQQYANKLLLRGYKSGLQQLAQQSQEQQNLLLQEIKLLPGHKHKFLDLFKQLNEHIGTYNDNTSQPINHNKYVQNRNTLPGQFNSHGKFEQTKDVYMQILKPINRKASMRHFSPSQEMAQIKPRILPKLEQVSNKGKKESSIEELNSKQVDLQITNFKSEQIPQKKEVVLKQSTKNIQNYSKKLNQTKKQLSDLNQHQEKSFKFINKLLLINGKNCNEINLEREQINLMYQSFDNGRLASTLINIDIEEISYCVGISIKKMMVIADIDLIKNLNSNVILETDDKQSIQSDNENIIKDDNYDEFIQNQTFQKNHNNEKQSPQDQNLDQYQDEDFEENFLENLENNDELICNTELNYQKEQFQPDDQNKLLFKTILSHQLPQSQFSVDTTLNLQESILYNKVFIDMEMQNYIPNVDIIQNYCKNIMITTKMEREVAIISMIYINRLLEYNETLQINCLNWQKILFTSLVMASKIWDDESFENNNFAKVLPQFSTVQINEMEKVFLKLIEYHLYVNSGDYAKQYFLLRTYADKKQRSYAVKQLDIATVLRLQKGVQLLINKQQFLNTLNKSF